MYFIQRLVTKILNAMITTLVTLGLSIYRNCYQSREKNDERIELGHCFCGDEHMLRVE